MKFCVTDSFSSSFLLHSLGVLQIFVLFFLPNTLMVLCKWYVQTSGLFERVYWSETLRQKVLWQVHTSSPHPDSLWQKAFFDDKLFRMVCWGRTNHWAALIVREGNQSGTMCTIPSLKRLSNPSQKRFSSLKIPLFSSRAVVMANNVVIARCWCLASFLLPVSSAASELKCAQKKSAAVASAWSALCLFYCFFFFGAVDVHRGAVD